MKIYHIYHDEEIEAFNSIHQYSYDIDIKHVRVKREVESLNSGIVECIKEAHNIGHENIGLCTNGHLLPLVSRHTINQKIVGSDKLNAKIILFNAENVDTIMPVSDAYFWIDRFYNSEFIVLNRECFPAILNDSNFLSNRVDEYLSKLTSNKLLINPMVFNDAKKFNYMNIRMSRIAEKKRKIDQFR